MIVFFFFLMAWVYYIFDGSYVVLYLFFIYFYPLYPWAAPTHPPCYRRRRLLPPRGPSYVGYLSHSRIGVDRKPELLCPGQPITRPMGAGPQATAPPPPRPLVNKFHPIRSLLHQQTWRPLIRIRIKRWWEVACLLAFRTWQLDCMQCTVHDLKLLACSAAQCFHTHMLSFRYAIPKAFFYLLLMVLSNRV